MTAKICLACEEPIKGRADKKFCDDSCRNNYNNRMNNYTCPVVRSINIILRRNRKILEELLALSDKKTRILDRQQLIDKGFRFEYITELYRSETKEHYYYCYEYGYRSLENEKIMVVKDTRKKQYKYRGSHETNGAGGKRNCTGPQAGAMEYDV